MDPADVDELQQIAEYRRARKTLRAAGIGGIIFGVLALAVGMPLLAVNPLNIVLVLIGALLLAEGIWNVSYPTAEGVIVDGLALLLVGLWNIFITFFNALAAGGGPGAALHVHWAVVGVFQIGYGVYRFASYRRFTEAFAEKPSAEDLKQMDQLVKKILKMKPKGAEDVITFQTTSSFKQQVWTAQLAGDAAMFVAKVGHDVLVAHKEEVDIEVHGKALLGKTLKATFRIRDHTMKGLISPESYAKYEDWKAPEVDLA